MKAYEYPELEIVTIVSEVITNDTDIVSGEDFGD